LADDPNPVLRGQLEAQLGTLLPEIRGLHDLLGTNISSDLAAQINLTITVRERRRDLTLAVVAALDATLAALQTLEADGYPSLPPVQMPAGTLAELAGDLADLEAARAIFVDQAVATNFNQAAPFTDQPQPVPAQTPVAGAWSMANYQLPNDVIRTFSGALSNLDAAGVAVPNPGATFSATVVPAGAVGVVIGGATGTDVTVNATSPNQVGVVVTFTESGGTAEASFDWTLDIVDDLTPRAVSFNAQATVTDVPQPVPPQA
jgi:hypothetical protein